VQVLLPKDTVALPLELVDEGGVPLDPHVNVDHGAASLATLALAARAPIKIDTRASAPGSAP
jgi:hypothetical protein